MWKHTLVVAAAVVVFCCASSLSVSVPTTESESSKDENVEEIVSDPSDKDYQSNNENVNQLDDDEPVRYDGAQVWRLGFTGVREKNAVSDLQHNFGNNPPPVNQRHLNVETMLFSVLPWNESDHDQ